MENRTGCELQCAEQISNLGKFELLKWLICEKRCTWGKCPAIVAEGNFEFLKWAHENGCPLTSKKYFVFAAALGNIEMLEWLLKNGATKSSHAWTAAVMMGHSNVVTWLEENHIVPTTSDNLTVNEQYPTTSEVLSKVFKGSIQLKKVKDFRSSSRKTYEWEFIVVTTSGYFTFSMDSIPDRNSSKACSLALAAGNVAGLKILIENNFCFEHFISMEFLSTSTSAAKWVSEQDNNKIKLQFWIDAAKQGHLHLFSEVFCQDKGKLLTNNLFVNIKEFIQTASISILHSAVKSRHFPLVKLLVEKYNFQKKLHNPRNLRTGTSMAWITANDPTLVNKIYEERKENDNSKSDSGSES